MSTNKKPTLKTLSDEVSLLRSFVIGAAGRDAEGEYKPEFVEHMLRSSATDKPRREFVNGREFLRRVRRPA